MGRREDCRARGEVGILWGTCKAVRFLSQVMMNHNRPPQGDCGCIPGHPVSKDLLKCYFGIGGNWFPHGDIGDAPGPANARVGNSGKELVFFQRCC